MYTGFVVEIKDLRPHSNADRLQIATIFGNSVVVDLNTHLGDIGVYFPVDGQLSAEFCEVNDLVIRKDTAGNRCGGYLDPDKRNIKAIRLRGEKSEGLYLPITCLAEFCKVSSLNVGDTISVVNGQEICKKYIPAVKDSSGGAKIKAGKKRSNICPAFHEHIDTPQLAYNFGRFSVGDTVELTLKIHGTSGRTGYLPVEQPQNFIERLLRKPVKYAYKYISGTRRVVLAESDGNGYYGDNTFRYEAEALFKGKLQKGEVVYYEIAGYTNDGTPIRSTVSNKETKDKEFIKMYGDTTTFSYGCAVGEHKVFVYRMTLVNEDGYEVDYSPELMRKRCEQMNVNCVPQFEIVKIPDFVEDKVTDPGAFILSEVEKFYDGPDPIGQTHIREGVVARILNHPGFDVYKHKNFYFKVIEGIAKNDASAPDMEEAQELIEK